LNRLFVVKKPTGISSNHYLGRIKRRYGVKKAGFSGTLDPFAKGVLIVAFGNHGRLFRFLNKTPKRYRATLWLGAYSPTLDIEGIEQIDSIEPIAVEKIETVISSLQGELTYLPPKFSAKRLNGKRAYEFARAGIDVELKSVTSTIHEIKMLHYCHPFVTFEASVSEGSYIRSLGEIIADTLGCSGSLSALERLNEGAFVFDNETEIDIKTALAIPKNRYNGAKETILLGQPLDRLLFEITSNGTYWIDNDETISIIEITDEKVHYLLNKVEAC
jgi:tRNA pseudouridine55 synthase